VVINFKLEIIEDIRLRQFKVWGYGIETNRRYVGFMLRTHFINKVKSIEPHHASLKWVTDRVGEDGNVSECRLAYQYPNKIILCDDDGNLIKVEDI